MLERRISPHRNSWICLTRYLYYTIYDTSSVFSRGILDEELLSAESRLARLKSLFLFWFCEGKFATSTKFYVCIKNISKSHTFFLFTVLHLVISNSKRLKKCCFARQSRSDATTKTSFEKSQLPSLTKLSVCMLSKINLKSKTTCA